MFKKLFKTKIFGILKNQIGTITKPISILIYTNFLQTLPENQLNSGFSEMLKHALIADKKHWEEIKNIKKISFISIEKYIQKSIDIKLKISNEDPFEQNQRKLLNFGHTLGHAIESYCFESKNEITHGHAIAIGMILESYISYQLNYITKDEFYEIKASINHIFKPIIFTQDSMNKIIENIKFDKKNSHGKVYFSIIDQIGHGIWDIEASNELIINSFNELKKN